MSHEDVQLMDLPVLRKGAARLAATGETFATISDNLKQLVEVLIASPFTRLTGGEAIAYLTQVTIPRIDQLANQCAEMSRDMQASIAAFERGDATGATRYY